MNTTATNIHMQVYLYPLSFMLCKHLEVALLGLIYNIFMFNILRKCQTENEIYFYVFQTFEIPSKYYISYNIYSISFALLLLI